MGNKKTKPTGKGNCFEAALKYLIDHDSKGIYLVHGEVTGRGPVKGIKFAHAWIEDENTGLAIDFNQEKPKFLPIGFYYRLGDIDKSKVKRYTFKQAGKLALKTNHYGPWEGSKN